MFFRIVEESIRRAPRRKALAVAAIAMGAAVATAMLGVMLDIGDKINRELRAEGANIVVTAKGASLTGGIGSVAASTAGAANYIDEARVPKIKTIFWGLNITAFSPSLSAADGAVPLQGVWFRHPYKAPNGEIKTTGIRDLNPAWQLQGTWPNDADSATANECLAGAALARRNSWQPARDITVLGQPCRLSGIVTTGDETDDRLLLPLALLQSLTTHPGQIDRIDVAALTKPEDDFARKDPRTMTNAEYERWSCTNYVTSIAHEIAEALPGTEARPVRRVADSEGKILDRIAGLMAFIAAAALLSAGLTVWSLTATTMMERRGEIAIMQAIGGARWLVASLFTLEAALMGLAGGLIGSLSGVFLARYVGQSVFHSAVEVSPVLPFVIIAAAIVIAVAGAAQPLRRALRMEPAIILREGL